MGSPSAGLERAMRYSAANSTIRLLLTCLVWAALPLSATAQGQAGEGRLVRMGLYENKPKLFVGPDGAPDGLFAGVARAIAESEGWQLSWVPCCWSECLELLRNGEIDLMPDVAISPERTAMFDFHREEVLNSWSQLYAGEEVELEQLSDLAGRRVSTLRGSIQLSVLTRMVAGLGYDVSIMEFDSLEEAFMAVVAGEADAVMSNSLNGDYYYEEYGLHKTALVFNSASLYFAAAAGKNGDLLEAVDRNLRRMKGEVGSPYYRELAKWMERPRTEALGRFWASVLLGVGGSLLAALLAIFVLRRRLRARTKGLQQAHEKVTEGEERFQHLFRYHSVVKLLIDPSTTMIVDANIAASRFYGWSVEQLKTMRIDQINTLSPEQVRLEVEKVRSGQQLHFEFRHRRADGSIRDVEVYSGAVPFGEKGLLYSVIHDITERRLLEEQLRVAQKMESVGRLAGGVAHDFNNMLAAIMGFTELAMVKAQGMPEVEEPLREVEKAAMRSADLTRQLLAFARRQPAKPESLDVNEAVRGMLKILKRLLGEEVSLEWMPGDSVGMVRMDPSQLDQILANLCVNARDAIAGSGSVTVSTQGVNLDADYVRQNSGALPGSFVCLSVEDSGAGIPAELLSEIFEPFFTTKEVGKGTGLGLSTVYGVVKQNGGFIDVSSQLGKGTRFSIFLPMHEPDNESRRASVVVPAGNGGSETVLIVDDEPSVLGVVARTLEQCGYSILAARTPSQAIEMARSHPGTIHLLLTDVVLPEMNGPGLAREIARQRPDIRCLLMSGYASDVVTQHGVAHGDVQFLQKPFSVRELRVGVRQALDRK